MSEPTLGDVIARVDDLLKEVRRQGRAAVAAQAAAESCLEAIQVLVESRQLDVKDEDEGEDEDEGAPGEPATQEAVIRWLRTLIPIVDAIDRIASQAASVAALRSQPRRWWLRFLQPAAEPEEDRRVLALGEGLRVLKEQLQAALGDLGVTIDRRAGEPVDPERHRVVEVRPPRAGERPGTVVEIVRPGYALGATVVRETEVVATGDGAPSA